MYSTCIHCQRDLGRNELLEHLPIGRRFAYDEVAGRVWVICAGCSRWNLVPFESRWEAIEEAEKTYRGTPLRASTDQVGLAKTREGSELVRIGKPLVPELASWRYGRHFAKRRWTYATTTLPISALAMLATTQPNTVMSMANVRLPGWWQLAAIIGLALTGSELKARFLTLRTLATLPLPDGTASLNRGMLPRVMASPGVNGELRVWVPVIPERIERWPWFSFVAEIPRTFGRGFMRGDLGTQSSLMTPTHYTALSGDEASSALRTILPIINEAGASKRSLDESLTYLQRHDNDPSRIAFAEKPSWELATSTSLQGFHSERLLALEMAMHADSERRWLEGEMAALLEEWRRANEIASIADSLLRDPALEAKLDTLRDQRAVNDG